MKILVFSDSHSRSRKIAEVLERHKGVCDAIVFCGDGIRDMEYIKSKYPSIAFFMVRGNCDFFEGEYPEELFVTLDGIKIMIAHGHRYGVKFSLKNIALAAYENGAQAVFFGHTHTPCDTIEDIKDSRLHLFNPGSIGMSSTYGVVNTSGNILVTNIAEI
ncbi:MAG: metallophosphoesterase [Clostridia bacterium]|nr:metallophosphoesterase [Clostridia bacterium]